MKSERCALYGSSDHPDDCSENESIDGDDLPPNQVMEDQVEHVVGEGNGSSVAHPGGFNVSGQNLVITESADGSEILIFLQNDPALSQLVSKPHDSVNSIEDGIGDVCLDEEDSIQKDISPDDDDSKQKDSEQEDVSPNEDLKQEDM